MYDINKLIDEYNLLNSSVKNAGENSEKEMLERINDLTIKIREELEKEQIRGNASEELIYLSSKFDANVAFNSKKEDTLDKSYTYYEDDEPDESYTFYEDDGTDEIEPLFEEDDLGPKPIFEEKNIVYPDNLTNKNTSFDEENKSNDEKIEENKSEDIYNLSSEKIVSKYTGEEIDISNMTIVDKVKTIYDHTGIEINNTDPKIEELCNIGFQKFLRGCNPSTYEKKYGENWQEVIKQIYTSGYMETMQRCMANALNEVDEKNRQSEKNLSKQLEDAEKEIDMLTSEIKELREQVSELTDKVRQIQDERKEELETYKKAMLTMVKNNSEDKNRFYSDGTLRPDMSDNDYGRYTTYRDTTSETGMQERINDVVHVHSPLDQREKERAQRKYEQVFGSMPMQEDIIEEDKPKSR